MSLLPLLRSSRSSRQPLAALVGAFALAACANSTFDPNDGDNAQAGGAGTSASAAGKGGGAGKSGGAAAGEAGAAPGGSGGKGGASGKGGSAGKGGNAGKGGAAGESGAAGTDAEAGEGGSSGAGGASGKGGSGGKGGASGKAGAGGTGGKAGTSGEGGAAGTGTGGAAGGAPPLCVYAPDEDAQKDDACFTCWNATIGGESCKVERAACDGDPACAAFFECVVTCPGEDSSCEKKCGQTAPAKGKELYEVLRDCVVNGDCKDSCKDHFQELLSLDMCKHDVCTTGMILYRDCSPEADAICEADATCCGGFEPEWGNGCVEKAEKAGYCPVPGCLHTPCAPGAPLLNKACSPCVSAICDQFPQCCSPLGKWDPACANAVATVCNDL